MTSHVHHNLTIVLLLQVHYIGEADLVEQQTLLEFSQLDRCAFHASSKCVVKAVQILLVRTAENDLLANHIVLQQMAFCQVELLVMIEQLLQNGQSHASQRV